MTPLFVMGRPSIVNELTVMVVPFGMVRSPLPPSVPFDHVIALFVTLIGSVPLSVPKLIASVGTLIAEVPLSVSVPLEMVSEPTLVMELRVVAPPLESVVPVTLYAALTVLVPLPHCTLPAPLMFDAASN